MGLLAAAFAVVPATAGATFPGRNGQLAVAVERGDCPTNSDQECGELHLEIVGINPRSGRRTSLDVCPSRFCEDRGASWSPDGNWLAFSRPGEGDRRNVVLARPDGTGFRTVAENGGRAAWSRDGSQLVFERTLDDETSLLVTSSEGGPASALVPPTVYQSDWSWRDRIAFQRGDDLYSVRPDGTRLRRLTRVREQFGAASANWAPGGRRLAFVRFEPPLWERPPSVWVMRADGGAKRQVVRDALSPAWSPDGKWIAFSRGHSVFVVRPDGSGLRLVRRVKARIERIAWQPRP